MGFDIAVDAVGNAYVVGATGSEDFPTTPEGLYPSRPGDSDGFITVLNPRGSRLAYSTYLGGTGYDEIHTVALDTGGYVYVAGDTQSTNYPTTAGAFRPTYAGGNWDTFLTKLRLPIITTISAAGFQPGAPVAPESAAAGYGPEMSPVTQVASYGLVDVEAVGPGLFTPNFDGQGAPVASVVHLRPDSSQNRDGQLSALG